MSDKTRLGKGLESLIPTYASSDKGTTEIEIEKIAPNPEQPRARFDDEELKELTLSVKKFGILQPLVLVSRGSVYELIAGERRLRAAKAAGLNTVPAVVRDANAQDKLEMAVVENVQRANLNPMELCHAYTRLNTEYGLSQDEIAERFGKSRSAISNCMRLSDLPPVIQQGLKDAKITEGHARTLLALDDKKEMIGLYELLLTEGWSVRELERRVKGYIHPQDLPKPKKAIGSGAQISGEEKALLESLRDHLGAKVSMRKNAKGGVIEIEYYSQEELDRISQTILKK